MAVLLGSWVRGVLVWGFVTVRGFSLIGRVVLTGVFLLQQFFAVRDGQAGNNAMLTVFCLL